MAVAPDPWEDFFSTAAPSLAGDPVAADVETRKRNVRAATAYLLEYFASLPGQSHRVEQHARGIAYILSERRFPFTGKEASGELDMHPFNKDVRANNPLILKRGKQIERQRRHYRGNASKDTAVPIFKAYVANPPFNISDWRAALAWWYEELMRNDY